MRSFLRPGRLFAALVLAIAVTAAVLWIFPSNEYLLLPDPAHPVAPLVKVQGEKKHRGAGGIYFVDVLLRRAKLFESFFPWVHSGVFPRLESGISLVPAHDVNPPGGSDAARTQEALREMRRSQSIAAAVALRALGYHVLARPTGVLVTAVDPRYPAAGKLQPTDILTAVDGTPVLTPRSLRRVMGSHHPGEVVRFTLHRGKELKVVAVPTVADPNELSRPFVGILVDQAADVQLPLKVSIDSGEIGGPSAGLAFALEVMEKLGRNLDHGYKVAATGEISLDGFVGAIGGVKQKTIGARRSHVDVFLVPAGDNAAEARRYADGLRIIPVHTFPQALRALATLPPRR